MLILILFSLLKINITPYGEFFLLTYWDEIWNLEGYIFQK